MLDLTKLNELKDSIQNTAESSVIYFDKIGKEGQRAELFFQILDVTDKMDGLFCQKELAWFFDGERVLSPASVDLPCAGMELWEEIKSLRNTSPVKEILKDYMSFRFSQTFVFPIIALEWQKNKFVSEGLKFAVVTPAMLIQLTELFRSPMSDPEDWCKYVFRCYSTPKAGNQKGRNYFFEQSKKTYTLTEEEVTALDEVDMIQSVKQRMKPSEYCEAMLRWKFEGADKPDSDSVQPVSKSVSLVDRLRKH